MVAALEPDVFSLQDSDRDWSGRPPNVPGRAGLSEQRRVTCWIELEHDGICSSQKETGVIFVCCTFTPLFHSTIKKKKKSFWSKINLFIVIFFLQHMYSLFSSHKLKPLFHQLCLFFLFFKFNSRGKCLWEHERCRALPLSFLLWLWMH